MSMGLGIALFVIGAILTFAVSVAVPGVDLSLIGYILMGAGLVVFIVGLVLMTRRRTATTTERTTVDPASGSQVRQTSTDVDPQP